MDEQEIEIRFKSLQYALHYSNNLQGERLTQDELISFAGRIEKFIGGEYVEKIEEVIE